MKKNLLKIELLLVLAKTLNFNSLDPRSFEECTNPRKDVWSAMHTDNSVTFRALQLLADDKTEKHKWKLTQTCMKQSRCKTIIIMSVTGKFRCNLGLGLQSGCMLTHSAKYEDSASLA